MRPAKHERQLWQLVNCAIAVATLTLLTWVGIRGWQCASGIADGARCLSVAGLLAPLLTALGAWAIGLAVWRNEKHGPAAPFFWLIAAGLASGALDDPSHEIGAWRDVVEPAAMGSRTVSQGWQDWDNPQFSTKCVP